ncbi:neutral zinc metallopeptidase [Corynebacterium phoceense]|uniref:KPN_02809 family neutral zinc metallopeptidase n=1 Tax=Corynebacterium phoceense TaxID=1686286 RepID=UPI00211C7F5E|nr:neutral zinc metallopeptidase [Corynebacterium phoceense]MCQ9332689.1 neutral zinc metallopeptidase [Corynebacterium phoceense]
MTFRPGANYEGRRARSGSGGRRGGTIAAGGGIGTLLLIGLFLLMGGNPGDLGGMLGANDSQGQIESGEATDGTDPLAHCDSAEAANKYDDCRVEATARSVDQVWTAILPEQAGLEYTQPGEVIFQDAVNTGCGYASAQTGPFYCPSDQSAYFDTSFFDQLTQFGAENAPLAQEYIVAHEFGHHIQQIEGTLGLSNYNQPGEDSNAVKIELQADCYAGIWAHHASEPGANGEEPYIDKITDEQAQSAIDTARAVGDDNIQRRSGGQVRPDQWTHGSSEQRGNAFLTGYREGTMSACDYLERGAYKS